MDKREFWATKSPLPEIHAVTFSHASFGDPIRLVANQFEAMVLAGNDYTPAPMSIKPPDQSGDARARLQISFPRAVVGREFKRRLALLQASGSREPIAVAYDVYTGDTAAPQLTWRMYVSDASGVIFGAETVQVTATDNNPMRWQVAPIYSPDVWTGLELI